MAINTTTNTVWLTVGTGLDPQGVVGDPTNTIYVTDSNTTLDNVTVINGTTGAELGSISVGWHPAGIVYVPADGCIYLANLFSDTLSIIHLPPAPPLTSRVVFSGPSSGSAPRNVTMDARAGGGIAPYSYTWEFGDGSAATGMDVTHTYQCSSSTAENGTCVYHVTLTTTDSNGTSVVSTATVSVSSQSTMMVSVTASPAVGVAPLAVNFAASAAGGSQPYAFSWDFGDGSTGSGATVQHVYQLPGTYTAVATATDPNGAVAQASTVLIVYPAPGGNQTGAIEVTISATNATGPAPLTTQFTASAANGQPPYTFDWNFGDGSEGASGQSVSHTYTASGEYTAILAVSDSAGNEAATGVIISVGANSSAASQLRVLVTAYNLHGDAPLAVTFLPSVLGGVAPYTLVWSFGDGSTASTTSTSGVTHTYSSAGTYTPTLKITDAKGTIVTWDENAPAQTHYVVSVSSRSSTSAMPLADWVIVGIVIVVVVALVLVLRSRKMRRPPTASPDQKGGPSDPYGDYHSQGQPQGGTEGNRASRPQRPIPPASVKAVDDPLGDSF
jgi:PKD repeat protein